MAALSHSDLITLLLALAILLGTARILGELFVRLHQPAVIGELCAGILLGPTILGKIFPAAHAALFPTAGTFPVALGTLSSIAIIFFLLVAGMEVDLATVWRQGTTALCVGILGLAVPFAIGFCFSWFTPIFSNSELERDPLVFSLFLATALSISALPVIAKILMDLGLFRTDLGMIVIAAAILNDLVGWLIFALLLGLISADESHGNIFYTVVFLAAFLVFMLTAGKRLLDKALPWLQAHTSWPGGILGFTLTTALACAALTEWFGIHGIFGAFIFGVAIGDSKHLRGRTRRTLEQFISFIFAPLFFATIGLHVDFVSNFEPLMVLVVLLLATAGKLLGCGLGARLCGMGTRESLAVGFAMNARGAMEVILGLVALQAGLINEPLFVALVIMALVTSVCAATAMQLILRLKKPRRFYHQIPARAFLPELKHRGHRTAIEELAQHLAAVTDLDPVQVAASVWRREEIMSTSLGGGIAVPHARLEGLKNALIAVGLSREGVDFESEGDLVHVIFLILTPNEDPELQIEMLADIARTFQRPNLLPKVMHATTATELLSLFKTADVK